MIKDWYTEVEWGQEKKYNYYSAYWKLQIMRGKLTNDARTEECKSLAMQRTDQTTKTRMITFDRIYHGSDYNIAGCLQPVALIKVRFTLDTPYISKDDDELYFLDNPVTKETVYKVPYISSTSWKGMLRHACFQSFWRSKGIDLQNIALTLIKAADFAQVDVDKHRLMILNLFGHENDNMEQIWEAIYHDLGLEQKSYIDAADRRMNGSEGLQGRLRFYSSFFIVPSKGERVLDYAVINPLDSLKRNSKHGPIIIETVAVDSTSEFTVLYFPYDLILRLRQTEREQNPTTVQEIKSEVTSELKLVVEGLRSLFFDKGISAKSKAGFGKCKNQSLSLHCDFLTPEEAAEIEQRFISGGE